MPTEMRSGSDVLDSIVKELKNGKTFCFSGHKNPDADVVGSQLALTHLLHRWDPSKKISICNSGKPPVYLDYLPGFNQVQSVEKVEGQFDVVVVFECSGADRMGNIIDLKTQAKTVINIDHHLHNPHFGHVNFVESTTSSTAELIFKIFQHAGESPTKDEALCLYTGVVADTGWFRYSNTNPQTHRIASELLAVGVPVAELSEKIYMSRTEPGLKLVAWVLSNIKLEYDKRVSVIRIPLKKFKELNASSDDLDEVVNQGLLLKSAVVSVLLKEKPENVVKISLRSKGTWDINKVARHFGGGGHLNASGCTFEGSLAEAEKAVLAQVNKLFQ